MFVPDRLAWLAELVPLWLRSRWPLRRFYWQEEELVLARERAREVGAALGWGEQEER